MCCGYRLGDRGVNASPRRRRCRRVRARPRGHRRDKAPDRGTGGLLLDLGGVLLELPVSTPLGRRPRPVARGGSPGAVVLVPLPPPHPIIATSHQATWGGPPP